MERRKLHPIAEAVGWCGPAALILAYALVSFNIIDAHESLFQILNLVGGAAIIVISLAKRVYQSVVLNIFWCAIALLALLRIFF